jgi:hypothetical protein
MLFLKSAPSLKAKRNEKHANAEGSNKRPLRVVLDPFQLALQTTLVRFASKSGRNTAIAAN